MYNMSALEDKLALQIKLCHLPEPAREYRFSSTRRWRADFAWPDQKVIVEVEGGIYSHGRHVRAAGFVKDCDKYNAAIALGYKVYRFTCAHINNGSAIKFLEQHL